VLLHRLHYALPGWDAAAERRDAQDEFHSAAQARAWADGDFDADHGFVCFRRRGPPGSLEPGARPNRGGGGGCARALAVYISLLHQKKKGKKKSSPRKQTLTLGAS
jgi:hypothetical protein